MRDCVALGKYGNIDRWLEAQNTNGGARFLTALPVLPNGLGVEDRSPPNLRTKRLGSAHSDTTGEDSK